MNLTYLLGAGASALSIPTVKNIKEESMPSKFAGFMNYCNPENVGVDWELLQKQITSSYSFDTYAKKLKIQRSESYRFLKIFIQCYVLVEHLAKSYISTENRHLTPLDERYMPWLLSLINPDQKAAKNINIVTWNYDLQIQLTLCDIFNSTMDSQIYHGTSPYSLSNSTYNFRPIYLNGSILDLVEDIDRLINIKKEVSITSTGTPTGYQHDYGDTDQYFRELISKFMSMSENRLPLKFAWDNIDSVIQNTIAKIHTSDALVVIGYSFPLFNRLWDKALINGFLNSNKMKIIYVQDSSPDGPISALRSMISSDFVEERDYRIVKETNTDMFFVPYDFDPEH
jgi:hypothetical protein